MKIGRAILNAARTVLTSPRVKLLLSLAATAAPAAGCHSCHVDRYQQLQFQVDNVEIVAFNEAEDTVRLAPVTPNQIRPFPETICSANPKIQMYGWRGGELDPAGDRDASPSEVAIIFNGERDSFSLMGTIYIVEDLANAVIPGMPRSEAVTALNRGKRICTDATVVMLLPGADFSEPNHPEMRPHAAVDNLRTCE